MLLLITKSLTYTVLSIWMNLKSERETRVRLTEKRLGRFVRLCKFSDNKNESKCRNPGDEKSPCFSEYRFLLPGDSWLECSHILLKTRVVCPHEETNVFRWTTNRLYRLAGGLPTDSWSEDWWTLGCISVFYSRIVWPDYCDVLAGSY